MPPKTPVKTRARIVKTFAPGLLVITGINTMEKDTEKTNVIFLIDADDNKTVFAFFPDLLYNKELHGEEMKTCYVHLGQHSACQQGYADECQPATPEQYKELFDELENMVGYNLNILPHKKNVKPSVEYNGERVYFTKELFEEFQKEYAEAVKDQKESFKFGTLEYVTSYAKYVIEYLTDKF